MSLVHKDNGHLLPGTYCASRKVRQVPMADGVSVSGVLNIANVKARGASLAKCTAYRISFLRLHVVQICLHERIVVEQSARVFEVCCKTLSETRRIFSLVNLFIIFDFSPSQLLIPT